MNQEAEAKAIREKIESMKTLEAVEEYAALIRIKNRLLKLFD